jgi:hypothetical protein
MVPVARRIAHGLRSDDALSGYGHLVVDLIEVVVAIVVPDVDRFNRPVVAIVGRVGGEFVVSRGCLDSDRSLDPSGL